MRPETLNSCLAGLLGRSCRWRKTATKQAHPGVHGFMLLIMIALLEAPFCCRAGLMLVSLLGAVAMLCGKTYFKASSATGVSGNHINRHTRPHMMRLHARAVHHANRCMPEPPTVVCS